MAELPGWDRDRLRTASDADVAGARLMVYVRQFRTFLSRDLKREIEDVIVASKADKSPRLAADHERRRRNQLVEDLKEAAKLQASIRQVLGMDPVDG